MSDPIFHEDIEQILFGDTSDVEKFKDDVGDSEAVLEDSATRMRDFQQVILPEPLMIYAMMGMNIGHCLCLHPKRSDANSASLSIFSTNA